MMVCCWQFVLCATVVLATLCSLGQGVSFHAPSKVYKGAMPILLYSYGNTIAEEPWHNMAIEITRHYNPESPIYIITNTTQLLSFPDGPRRLAELVHLRVNVRDVEDYTRPNSRHAKFTEAWLNQPPTMMVAHDIPSFTRFCWWSDIASEEGFDKFIGMDTDMVLTMEADGWLNQLEQDIVSVTEETTQIVRYTAKSISWLCDFAIEYMNLDFDKQKEWAYNSIERWRLRKLTDMELLHVFLDQRPHVSRHIKLSIKGNQHYEVWKYPDDLIWQMMITLQYTPLMGGPTPRATWKNRQTQAKWCRHAELLIGHKPDNRFGSVPYVKTHPDHVLTPAIHFQGNEHRRKANISCKVYLERIFYPAWKVAIKQAPAVTAGQV